MMGINVVEPPLPPGARLMVNHDGIDQLTIMEEDGRFWHQRSGRTLHEYFKVEGQYPAVRDTPLRGSGG